jgi:hypothetical protein
MFCKISTYLNWLSSVFLFRSFIASSNAVCYHYSSTSAVCNSFALFFTINWQEIKRPIIFWNTPYARSELSRTSSCWKVSRKCFTFFSCGFCFSSLQVCGVTLWICECFYLPSRWNRHVVVQLWNCSNVTCRILRWHYMKCNVFQSIQSSSIPLFCIPPIRRETVVIFYRLWSAGDYQWGAYYTCVYIVLYG